MFVLVENDSITKTLQSNRGITIGENQYPRSIYSLWSSAEREAIGIYEVVFDNSNQKDGEYYNNTSPSLNFADGTVTSSYGSATERALEDATDENGGALPGLKSKKKVDIKKQASYRLTSTDWYVIKATEVESYSVPANLTTHRAAIRTTSNDMEALVDACTTVDELVALYMYDAETHTRPLGEFPILGA